MMIDLSSTAAISELEPSKLLQGPLRFVHILLFVSSSVSFYPCLWFTLCQVQFEQNILNSFIQ